MYLQIADLPLSIYTSRRPFTDSGLTPSFPNIGFKNKHPAGYVTFQTI